MENINEPKEIEIVEDPKNIITPENQIDYAQRTARLLTDIVSKHDWAIAIDKTKPNKKYLQFEAWQTLGKFWGYTVKVESTEFVNLGVMTVKDSYWTKDSAGRSKKIEEETEVSVRGYNAKAIILDKNGTVIGGAEGSCLTDEKTWRDRQLFALKSMAQTRACSRAYRQILAWVAVLAGYEATPAEEVTDEMRNKSTGNSNGYTQKQTNTYKPNTGELPKYPVSRSQLTTLEAMLEAGVITQEDYDYVIESNDYYRAKNLINSKNE